MKPIPRRHALLPALVFALGFGGCGGTDSPAPLEPGPVSPLPPGTPLNDSPLNTMIRFEAAYETRVLAEYLALFTDDFSFRFSSQADPVLVSRFGSSWGRSRDSISTRHLFDGFTNDQGDFVPAATGIALSLPAPQVLADPDRPDSAAHYRLVIVPNTQLSLALPGDYGFEIAAPHDFHLVRGDAAVLRAGQAADSTRWYVHRWTDRSPALALRARGRIAPEDAMPASVTTWGSIKALYLE